MRSSEQPSEAVKPSTAGGPSTLQEPGPFPSEGGLIIPEAGPKEAAQASEPEGVVRYTVKTGDTLWDITEAILKDPFLWPKVWRDNPSIQNPDLIFPGTVITFPAEAPPAQEPLPEQAMPPPAPVLREVPPAPEVALVPPVEVPPPTLPQPDLSLLASIGFILRDQRPIGTIVGGRDDRALMGEGEIAYILPVSKATLKTGDRLTVYRNVRKVYHPKTRKYIGDLIKILGMTEVIESQERVKTANILESYDYITKGDLALPYEPPELLAPASASSEVGAERGAAGSLRGYIVEVKDDRVSAAQSDIVYLDRGLRDGVRRGDRFAVVRPGEKTSMFSIGQGERLPRRIIGLIEILIAQDGTSTAQVIQSTDVIYKGDQFEPAPVP